MVYITPFIRGHTLTSFHNEAGTVLGSYVYVIINYIIQKPQQ